MLLAMLAPCPLPNTRPADFHVTKPRVPVLLSVVDTIWLEYDFKLGVTR